MRLTQYRIHAMECAAGLVSVALAKVDYDGGKIVGHELVLMDWCEPGQLEHLAGQFLRQLANAAYRSGQQVAPQPPL
jgi:hypothetical protein